MEKPLLIAGLLELLKLKKLNFKTVEVSTSAFIIEFDVLAKPASKVEKVFIGSEGAIVIQTRSRPIDGEANQAIILAISELIGISKSNIEILRGDKSKNKRVKLLVELTPRKNAEFFKKKFSDF
jgi:uncharacterized protein YggU (UPF0235/DUF167 family)